MWTQLDQFRQVRESFIAYIGAEATTILFSKSVFVISTGSNDLVDFFAAHGSVSYIEKKAYISSLVSTYKYQLQVSPPIENQIWHSELSSCDLRPWFNFCAPPVNFQLRNPSKSKYGHMLQRLYELGARKIGVVSAPPTGCCPSQRLFNATGGCLDEVNELSQMFYVATDAMLKDLSYDLKGLKYSLGNLFKMVVDFFQKAPLLGKPV